MPNTNNNVIDCPVNGTWMFMNPPGHHPAAKDLVAVDKHGLPCRRSDLLRQLFWRVNAEAFHAWERPVHAPFDGVVIQTEKGCEDRRRLNLPLDLIRGLLLARIQGQASQAFFLGNHLILRSDAGYYALFAHLRHGSIPWQVGDRLSGGDQVGLIGNSGNSIQPHLHFQLMAEAAPLEALPLPFTFAHCELREADQWRARTCVLPADWRVFRT